MNWTAHTYGLPSFNGHGIHWRSYLITLNLETCVIHLWCTYPNCGVEGSGNSDTFVRAPSWNMSSTVHARAAICSCQEAFRYHLVLDFLSRSTRSLHRLQIVIICRPLVWYQFNFIQLFKHDNPHGPSISFALPPPLKFNLHVLQPIVSIQGTSKLKNARVKRSTGNGNKYEFWNWIRYIDPMTSSYHLIIHLKKVHCSSRSDHAHVPDPPFPRAKLQN